jgi:peptidoglycan/LPS O-acetylase OafA/YrhL
MRKDIQFLRGLAVLLVLFYHGKITPFSGGYLGVDVFFVISGFLITTLIKKAIEADRFKFSEFYFRRARRLLPAAYTTFVVTALMASVLLTSQELRDFYAQMLGAITFTGNIVLWRQGTYFGVESELKPLLHTWSLAVEEQYYLIVPAALFFVSRRRWLALVVGATVLSFIAAVVLYKIQPGAAFYLFPGRAWELGIGSAGALLAIDTVRLKLVKLAFWPAILTIIVLAIHPIGGMHPGLDSLLVCVATLAVILAQREQVFDNRFAAIGVWLGDISYSLYLVHWPLFALAHNLWFSKYELPIWVRFGIIVGSILLAYWQYRFIEQPFRHAGGEKKRLLVMTALASSGVMVIATSLLLQHASTSGATDIAKRRGNTGFGAECTFKSAFAPPSTCSSGPNPSVMIWGDSNAMHLIPGVAETSAPDAILQATKFVCGPLLGIAPLGALTGSYQNIEWSRSCLSFNRSVLDYIARTPAIRTVALSSYLSQYLTPSQYHLYDGQRVIDGDAVPEYEAAAGRAFAETIAAVRALGRKVVIVAPPPAMDFDAGRCHERKMRGLISFGEYRKCDMPASDVATRRATVTEFLRRVEAENGVSVLTFNVALSDGSQIVSAMNGENVFIANAHLSYAGSRMLAAKMNLGQRIKAEAR